MIPFVLFYLRAFAQEYALRLLCVARTKSVMLWRWLRTTGCTAVAGLTVFGGCDKMQSVESECVQMGLFNRMSIRALCMIASTEDTDRRVSMSIKKSIVLFGAIAMGVVSFGLVGCQNVEEAAAPAAVEDAKVEHPATAQPAPEAAPEHPSTDKPKDHPAH